MIDKLLEIHIENATTIRFHFSLIFLGIPLFRAENYNRFRYTHNLVLLAQESEQILQHIKVS